MERITIALNSKVSVLQNRINSFFAKIDMSNPLNIIANSEAIVKMQNELTQIKIYKTFLDVIEAGEDVDVRLLWLLNEIVDGRITNSSCAAANAIELYKFDGKREAYKFLKDLIK